jgi:hypothetical protein
MFLNILRNSPFKVDENLMHVMKDATTTKTLHVTIKIES